MKRLSLELYVVGSSQKSRAAVENLRRICDQHVSEPYDLEVIDVLEEPQAAELANVLATPTLIKKDPPPRWRIVGDLSDEAVVIRGLGLGADDGGDGGTRV